MIEVKTIDTLPGIGLEHLGPDVDDEIAQLRAAQLSYFMRHEVHGPVYERKFGLRFIDTDPPSGTPGDIPWRVAAMRKNNMAQSDGKYREYVIAARLTDSGEFSTDVSAILGLVVVTKPKGLCTVNVHQPSYIAEIDVAQNMYGTGLARSLLRMIRTVHAADPYITMETYEGNERSQKFHGKLGFVIDESIPPVAGTVYEGNWITMRANGGTFYERLFADAKE